jgi:signal peptidase I
MGPVEELASQLLRRGGQLRIKARGGSMIPFIWDGDRVLVRPAGSAEILVGDVICYETSPGRLFLHRVIKRDREQFVTKGDALDFTDLVSPGQVLGKVVAVERDGRVRRLAIRVGRLWRAALCG